MAIRKKPQGFARTEAKVCEGTVGHCLQASEQGLRRNLLTLRLDCQTLRDDPSLLMRPPRVQHAVPEALTTDTLQFRGNL